MKRTEALRLRLAVGAYLIMTAAFVLGTMLLGAGIVIRIGLFLVRLALICYAIALLAVVVSMLVSHRRRGTSVFPRLSLAGLALIVAAALVYGAARLLP